MKFVFLSILLIILYSISFSQGEIEEEKMYNRSENSGSLLLNSNGWGINFRIGKRLDGYKKRLIDFDFVGIKHPKEQKIHHPSHDEKFVFGKLNSFFTLKTGYGYQKEIFSKFDKGGIAIKYFYLGGLSLGLLKPVYYEIYDNSNGDQVVNIQKFDPSSIHTVFDIYGQASFFDGLNETKIIPGGFLKFGFSFEYGKNDDIINAIEVGTVLEIFADDIQIMALNDPNQIFISLFIAYRYGKTIGTIKD